MGPLLFPSAAKDTWERAIRTLINIKISGNMTPLPIPGHEKQTSVVVFVAGPRDLALTARAMSERDSPILIVALLQKIFGNSTLLLIHGHRGPIAEAMSAKSLLASALAAKGILEQ